MNSDLEDVHISSSDGELKEPDPVWADAIRLCPQCDLPPYRYVRGLNPHPTRESEGHSYKVKTPPPVPFHEDNWLQCEPFVYGIDLYHQGYFWEAYHAWEELQKAAEKDSRESNFLQALMLNCTAMKRLYEHDARGIREKSQGARWRLSRLRSAGYDGPKNRLFGLDIAELIEQMKRFYSPAWWDDEKSFVQLTGDPPRLETNI